jgi:murein endopeptidase
VGDTYLEKASPLFSHNRHMPLSLRSDNSSRNHEFKLW